MEIKDLNVLIGCECSGTIRNAFCELGANAYSCDLKEDMSGSKWAKRHLKMDIFRALAEYWHVTHLFIAHPPCTFMANSGERWQNDARYPTRKDDRRDAVDFAVRLWESPILHIALENPVGALSTYGVNERGFPKLGNPSQIVHPYMFGDEMQKATCLWLKNLPKLRDTNVVSKGEFVTFSSGKKMPKWYSEAKVSDKGKTQETRSVTSKGIAEAMAKQWSNYIVNMSNSGFGSIFEM